MSNVIQPFHLLAISLAGWLNRQQQTVIDYLMEENRVLTQGATRRAAPSVHRRTADTPGREGQGPRPPVI